MAVLKSKKRKPPAPAPPVAETPKKKKMLSVRAQLGDGGQLHVRHMFDGAEKTVLRAGGAVALSAVADEGPVWNQIAKKGAFRGHPQGPFVIDDRTLSEIVDNFNATANKDVALDYEHASEQPPSSGSIPQAGAPATGHIRQLEVRNGELWGLVEWGQAARQQIREGAYRYLSPAIRFNSRDRVTGEKIGAVLSSAALTNKPFLDGMMPLAASDVGVSGDAPATTFAAGPLAHAPHEYMPTVKRALKLHELSTSAECSDRLGSLREAFDGNDGDVGMTHDGTDLASYMHPMRELVGAKPGDTWDDVFDAVESLIDAAIEEHEVKDHDMNDGAPAVALSEQHEEEPVMSMTAEEKAAFDKLQTTVSELTVKLTAAEASVTTEKTRADAAETELRTMRDASDNAEVGEIISRCKADGYTEALRPHLLSMLRNSPEAFRAMPKHKRPEAPEKAHLFTEATPPERRENPTVVMAEIANETVSQTTNRLMKTQHMSYAAALASANSMHGAR